jgi:hypothetical protein
MTKMVKNGCVPGGVCREELEEESQEQKVHLKLPTRARKPAALLAVPTHEI